jgi:SRSO17 transposase
MRCSRRSLGCPETRGCGGTGGGYLLGLRSHQERKNSRSLSEFAGDATPDGMQRLLNFSPWDEDAGRDALARYVAARMGGPASVLAIDETGFLKKGRMSAGVARMYTGTAGRVENCQVGVFAAYVTPDESSCTCRRSGRMTGTGAGRPGSATAWRSPRSLSWAGR